MGVYAMFFFADEHNFDRYCIASMKFYGPAVLVMMVTSNPKRTEIHNI